MMFPDKCAKDFSVERALQIAFFLKSLKNGLFKKAYKFLKICELEIREIL